MKDNELKQTLKKIHDVPEHKIPDMSGKIKRLASNVNLPRKNSERRKMETNRNKKRKKLWAWLAPVAACFVAGIICAAVILPGLLSKGNAEINSLFAQMKAEDVVFNSNSFEYNNSDQEQLEKDFKAAGNTYTDPKKGYDSEFQKVKAQTSIEDLTNFGLDDDIFWPGALLKVGIAGTPKQNSIMPLRLDRAPMTLSLNTEGATGITYEPQVVQVPSLSSSRAAVNKMVQQTQVPGAQMSLKLAAQMTEVKSTNDLSIALNVDVKSMPVNVKNNFEMNMNSYQTNAILMLKQIYYTVDMDSPISPSRLFDSSVSSSDFQNSVEPGEVPAYVASVTYGRIVIVQISSTMSYMDLQNKLNLDVNTMFVNVGTELELAIKNMSETTTMNYFIYGGSVAGNQTVLNQTEMSNIVKALNEDYDPTKMVGVPISYKFRYLDGSICKVSAVNEYVTQKLTPKPITSLFIEADSTYVNVNFSNTVNICLKTENDYGQWPMNFSIKDAAGRSVNPEFFELKETDKTLDGYGEYRYTLTIKEGAPMADIYLTAAIGDREARKKISLSGDDVGVDITYNKDPAAGLVPGDKVQFNAEIIDEEFKGKTVKFVLENSSDTRYVTLTERGLLTVEDLTVGGHDIAIGVELDGVKIKSIIAVIKEGTFIYNAAELYNVRNNLGGSYVLVNDINISSYSNWNPIGTSAKPFTGTFDGNGKIITGLKKSTQITVDYYGLFGCTNGAKIKDLCLKDINIVIPLLNGDTIVTYAGGIIGIAKNTTITNCSTYGQISAFVVGGIAGRIDAGTIIRECFNAAYIEAVLYGGGIVGWSDKDSVTYISNCYNLGEVLALTVGLGYSGGIIGCSNKTSLTNCYNVGSVRSIIIGVRGGIIGNDVGQYYTNINSYYLSGCGATKAVGSGASSYTAYEKTSSQMNQASTYDNWDPSVWILVNGSYPKLWNTPER